MLICVFGFQATTFAQVNWDGENSIPMDDAINVSPDEIATQFVLAFDEEPTITAAGGTLAVYKADGSLLKLVPINNSSSDVQIVEKTIVVNHGMTALAQEAGYYIVLTSGAVTVGDDATPVEITANEWNFVVGDFTAPMLATNDDDELLIEPTGDGVKATLVIPGEATVPFQLMLTFDEEVEIGEGTIAIYQENGTVVELIDVANLVGTQAIDIEATEGKEVAVTVNDVARFLEKTGYYVRVAPGAFVDNVDDYTEEGDEPAPNAFAGIEDNTTWTFSTRVNSSPVITASVTDVTGTTATLNVELDADGEFVYAIVARDATPVDVDYTDVAIVVEKDTQVEEDLTTLDSETEFDVYVIAVDELGNQTEDPGEKVAEFETLDNTAPIADYKGGSIIDDVLNDDGKTTGAMMYFNEEVIGGEGTLSVRKMENNALAAELDASTVTSTLVDADDDDGVDFEGEWRVVFDFGVELESAVDYYIVFHNGFITDLAGNEFADPVDAGDVVPDDKGEWVIQSSDFETPVVTFWTDTKDTETTTDIVDAGNGDVIYVQFDEVVSPVNGDSWSWLSSKDFTQYVSLKEDGILVEASYSYNSTDDRIEIDPVNDLTFNATYTVTLNPGVVADGSDNVIEDEHSIDVTIGDFDAPTYDVDPLISVDLGATTPLTIEFSKDVFVGDGETVPEIDHALTTADLADILTLSVDIGGVGEDLEDIDAADYTAVYDPATLTITVTYANVWPSTVCGVDVAEKARVNLNIDNSDLLDSEEVNFSGAADFTWFVEDHETPDVTLLSGDVEVTDMNTDNATIDFSELVLLPVDYESEATFVDMFTLKEGSAEGKNLAFIVAPAIPDETDGESLYTLEPDGWIWEAGETYYYGVGEIFADCADNYAPATYGTFTVVGDVTAPIVEALTYTVNGGAVTDIDVVTEGVEANDVTNDVVIVVQFNVNVDDKDLTNPVVVDFMGDEGIASIDVVITADDIDGDKLTITFDGTVLPTDSTLLMVTIPDSLVEANASHNGTDFAQLEEVVEINLISADGLAPAITGQSPVLIDGPVALDLDEGEMTIEFGEAVELGSGKITFTYDDDGTDVVEQSITVSSANIEMAENGMSAVVSVDALMLYTTVYTVDVADEAFEDAAGNDLGDVAANTWTYTTIDNELPVVDEDGLYPADGADLVPLSLDLQMTFTEDVVQAGTAGTRKLVYLIELNPAALTTRASINVDGDLELGDDEMIDFTYVENTDRVKVDGNLVTVLGFELEADKQYFVLITPGAFKDLSEPTAGDYAGIEDYSGVVGEGWDFQTGDVINAEAELDFTKLGLDELVAIDSDIKLVFTKPVVKFGGDDITDAEVATLISLYKDVEGVWVEINFTGTISADKKTITIDNSSLVILEEMVGSTEYMVSFAGSVLQSEGNETPLAEWDDTFMTSDYTAPAAPSIAFTTNEKESIYYAENSDEVMAHIAELTMADVSDDAVALYYFWTSDLDAELTAQAVKDLGVAVDVVDDLTAGAIALVFEEGMVSETEYMLVAVAEDLAGNLSEVNDFTYITDDVIAPELVGDLPTEFNTDSTLQLVFDEDVVPVEGAYARVIDENGVVYMADLVQLAGEDTDENVITIVLDAGLVPLAGDVAIYTIEIDEGMIVDVPRLTEDLVDANDSIAFEGIYGSSFVVTTADQTAPVLESWDPNNKEFDPVTVPLNPTFTLTFDEAVELNDNFTQFVLYEVTGMGAPEATALKSAVAFDAESAYDIISVDNVSGEGTSTITLSTNRELVSGNTYFVRVIGGTFSDLAGNEWEGMDIFIDMIGEDNVPLNPIFRLPVYNEEVGSERPFYLPYDGELPSVPDGQMVITFGDFYDADKVYSGFDPDDDDGDVIDHDEYFLSPDEPNIDLFELKEHVYFKVDGVDMPFEIEVSGSYNHKIWIVVDEDDLEDYRGMTITYGFVNLYDEAGNLNEGAEVSYVIAEDAGIHYPVTFTPGTNDLDPETVADITVDQVFTIEFDSIIYSYDGAVQALNNLIVDAEWLEANGVFTLLPMPDDAVLEVISYEEVDGKSIVEVKVDTDLDSETEYTLTIVDNKIQVTQGITPLNGYFDTYTTADVDAPKLIADKDGEPLEAAYLPVNDGIAGSSETLGLVFDEEVVGTGAVEIHRWDGQIVATVDITGNESAEEVDDDGMWILEIDAIEDIMAANAEFVTNEAYYVIVPDTSVVDMAVAPNAFAGITTINEWSFDLRDDAKPVAMFVQNEEMGIAVNTTIDLTFDREVMTTGNVGWLAIYEEVDGDAVELQRIENDASLDVAATSFSFDVSGLKPDTKYWVELGEGSFVLAADMVTAQEQVEIGTWWFSTEVDEAPEAIDFVPANEEELTYTVWPGSDLVITFDMEVAAGTGNIQLHNMLTVGDDIISSFDVTDPTQVIFDGTTLTIPGDVLGLVENASYYVIIPATAVANTTTTPEFWEGVTTPLAWKFSTVLDATVPVLESYTPQDTIVGNHPEFVMTFEEDVMLGKAGKLYVTAKDSTETSLEIEITADMIDGNVVTITYPTMPTDGLNINTTYIVNVDDSVFVNAIGNTWTNDMDWMFTTGTDFTTGIELPESAGLDFKVYPNPFNSFIRIDNYDKLTRVVITNIAGQRVLDIEYPSYEIQTGNLVTGVYVVSLIADDKIVKSDRIIKR